MSDADERRRRSVELAEKASKVTGPRFLTDPKAKPFNANFGEKSVEYEPLLIRRSDKETSLKLLTIDGDAKSDLALLIDTVIGLTRMLAEQKAEIGQLRAEVHALREERITTNVTVKVNEALMDAAKNGVSIDEIDFAILTDEMDAEVTNVSHSVNDAMNRAKDLNWSGTVSLGGIVSALANANLAASGAQKTAQYVNEVEETIRKVSKRSERKLSSKLILKNVKGSSR